jgi:Flp pilus assembly protein TadG
MTLELAIVAPALLVVLLFVIAAGRVFSADAAVAAAARDAARQSSIARTPAAAQAGALASARAALAQDGLDCSPAVAVDTAGFSVPVGQTAPVSASVTCAVPLSDLGLPWLPGAHTVRATFTSDLDPYRSR